MMGVADSRREKAKACSDCGRHMLDPDDLIPCRCGAELCETCYDDIHQQHGPPLIPAALVSRVGEDRPVLGGRAGALRACVERHRTRER